jgi:hypothetical protein
MPPIPHRAATEEGEEGEVRFIPTNKAGEFGEPVVVERSKWAPGNVYVDCLSHLSPDEAERVAAALVKHAKAARKKKDRRADP